MSICQYMSVMLSICLLGGPSVSICPSCGRFIRWAVHLSICQYMSVMFSICPLGRPSVHLSVHVRHVFYLSAGPSICPSVSTCPSCFLFVRWPVHLSTCLYINCETSADVSLKIILIKLFNARLIFSFIFIFN